MIFYVSCRPIKIDNRLHTPKEHFKSSFTGINFTFKLVTFNRNIDGRFLYQITLSNEYTEQEKEEFKTVILEGLALFSGHEKSLQSAKELAERLSDQDWEISDNKIVKV